MGSAAEAGAVALDRAASANGAPTSATVDRLKPNSVGLVGVIFMAVATAAPITAMTGNVPVALAFGNGQGVPATYLFATVVLTVFSIGYVTMARYITTAGAFYGFISHGLGRVVGMGAGLLTILAYVSFEIAITGIFASFADSTFNSQLGLDLPWQVFAFAMLGLVLVLSYFDIGLTAKLLAVLLITEISILLLMAMGVLLAGGGPDGIPLGPIDPVAAFEGPAPGLGLLFAFVSWVGFESTAMYGEESRNPKRIIPIATLVAVVGVGAFYVFVSWMAIAGNGVNQSIALGGSDAFAAFFDPTREYVGGWAVTLFEWLIITGSFACGMAFHNCAARYFYALGREGFLSRALGRTQPVHGTPYIASATQTAIAAGVIALFWLFGQDPFAGLYVLMAMLGTLAILVVQTLCSFAVMAYFHRHHRGRHSALKTFVAPLAGGIGMAAVVVLLIDNLAAAAGDASGTLFFDLIPWLVVGLFAGGVGVALYLRSARPERYAVIGRMIYEEAAQRPELDVDTEGRDPEPVVGRDGRRPSYHDELDRP